VASNYSDNIFPESFNWNYFFQLKNYNTSYLRITQSSRFHHIFFYTVVVCYLFTAVATASGGFDNGTATGKGKLGLDLTWNPMNYFPQGQSYIVIGYGIINRLDIHGYYSRPANGPDNYYYGIFYQFINKKYLHLASAIGIRQYKPKTVTHLFYPQLLYTINLYNGFRIGGSLVSIRNVKETGNNLGTARDISLIIPLRKKFSQYKLIENVDFCIGAFRPVFGQQKEKWHPTYSIDFLFKF